MTQAAMNNGVVLYALALDRKQVEESQRILNLVPELSVLLTSPVVEQRKKETVLDRIFSGEDIPKLLVCFLKAMCAHGQMNEINDIYAAYYQYWDEKNNRKCVRCTFAKEPDQNEMEQIRKFLQKKYPQKELVYEICIDRSILGGAVVSVGHKEYDWSYGSRLLQLGKVMAGETIF